jgi:endogenous inhibitor of DNA gyrase (YacG/DUF329 family)
MAAYKDICPVCGGEYENYDAAYRNFCSVACQFAPCEKECEHGYEVDYCVTCEEDYEENSTT